MTLFPAILPDSRAFTPGSYPAATAATARGLQLRAQRSTAMLESGLQLSFGARSRADREAIEAHYLAQQGGWLPFDLPPETLSGFDAAQFTLPGYRWRYAKPPAIEAFCGELYDITIDLVSVVDEGVWIPGLFWQIGMGWRPGPVILGDPLGTITTTWQPGAVELLTRLGMIATTWQPGTVDYTASGFGLLMAMNWSPGSLDFTVDGINQSLALGWSPGTVDTTDSTITAPGISQQIALSWTPGTVTIGGGSGLNRRSGLHLDGNLSDTVGNNAPSGGGLTFITTGQKYGSGAVTVDSSGYLSLSADTKAYKYPIGQTTQGLDFAFRFWIKIPNNTGDAALAGSTGGDGTYSSFGCYIRAGILKWEQNYNGTATNQSFGSVPVNTWAFIEIGRISGVIRASIDGIVSANTLVMNPSLSWEDAYMYAVGFFHTMSVTIDDFDFLTGEGPQTANFTPPAAAFT